MSINAIIDQGFGRSSGPIKSHSMNTDTRPPSLAPGIRLTTGLLPYQLDPSRWLLRKYYPGFQSTTTSQEKKSAYSCAWLC